MHAIESPTTDHTNAATLSGPYNGYPELASWDDGETLASRTCVYCDDAHELDYWPRLGAYYCPVFGRDS